MTSFVQRISKPWIVSTAALLATVIFVALALYPRRLWDYPPLAETNLFYLPVDIWSISDFLAAVAVQLILFYLISLTAPFQRFVTGEMQGRDRLQLVVEWIGFYLLSLLLFITLEDWFFSGMVLLVILSGYIGGWKAGLGAGAVTTFILGTSNLLKYGVAEEYQTEGLMAALTLWREDFMTEYLFAQEAAIYIWLGLMAGLVAQWLGDRRWSPAIAAGTGIVIVTAGGYLEAINTEDPVWVTEYLAPKIVAIGAGLAIAVLIVNTVQAEANRRRANAAELAKTRAELRALRAQINPHFLFNSLNTIRYFVRTDPTSARRLLVDLSDVFQHALRSGEFVALREEIRYVEAYLALEKARLDSRLQVNWYLPPEERLDELVPTLILQPIVENAVIHGIAKQAEGGSLNITIGAGDEFLEFVIEDDGTGIAPHRLARLLDNAPEQGRSIGLRNVNSRLQTLYGPGYSLAIQSELGTGTTVRFQVPVHDE